MIKKGSLVQFGNGDPAIFIVLSDPYRTWSFSQTGLVVDIFLDGYACEVATRVLKVISQ